MVITFLGTGTSQGVPVIGCQCSVCTSLDFRDKRTRTSVHLQIGRVSLVIDTGPDFRAQMLREGISELDAVLFTHKHKDHTAGLDDTRPFYFRNGQKNIPIYADKDTARQIKTEYYYAFEQVKYPGVPGFELMIIENRPFEIQAIPVLPIEVYHHKMPVFGFRFGDFVYITDANRIEPQEKLKMAGADVLVINALQLDWHISHFTLAEALALIEELKPRRAYLTHISHRLGAQAEVERNLPPHVRLAYDGLKLTL